MSKRSDEEKPLILRDRYVLGKEIGKGSFAVVYKGYDKERQLTYNADSSKPTDTSASSSRSSLTSSSSLKEHEQQQYHVNVAIKSVSKNALKNKKLLDNLEIEIAILKKINNPHIVKLMDCERTSTNFYLIMEYCSLGDLSFLIKKKDLLNKNHPLINKIFSKYPNNEYGGLNKVLVYNYIQQLSTALKFLRSKNLVHRDIKPQNLLLSAPLSNYSTSYEFHDKLHYTGVSHLPILKIADFGFARFLPNTSMAETLCGSPLYMAPEILSYQKYNAKADLWSVGGVLYEMCCGKPPFRANNHMELLKRIKQAHDEITFPVGLSKKEKRINESSDDDDSDDDDSDADDDDIDSDDDDVNVGVNSRTAVYTLEDDVLDRDMKQLICRLLTYDPVKRITFEEFFENSIIVKDLSIYELDTEKGKLEESIIEKESHKLLESNLFISEYLDRKSIQKEINSKDQVSQTKKPDSHYHHVLSKNKTKIPSPIQEEAETNTAASSSSTRKKPSYENNEDIEKEYVVIEKKTVEFNELADEVATYRGAGRVDSDSNGTKNNVYNNSSSSRKTPPPGNPTLMAPVGRTRSNSTSKRRPSFENRRKLSISSLNPSNALTKAIGIASSRLFNTPSSSSGVDNSLNNIKRISPVAISNNGDKYRRSSSFGSTINNSPRHDLYSASPHLSLSQQQQQQQQQQLQDSRGDSSHNQPILNSHVFSELTEQLVLKATDTAPTSKISISSLDSKQFDIKQIINYLENTAAKAFTIYSFSEIKYVQLHAEPSIDGQESEPQTGDGTSNVFNTEAMKNHKFSNDLQYRGYLKNNLHAFKSQGMDDNNCAIEDSDEEESRDNDLGGNPRGVPSVKDQNSYNSRKPPSPSSITSDYFFQSHGKAHGSPLPYPGIVQTNHMSNDQSAPIRLSVLDNYELTTEALLLYLKTLSLLAKGMNVISGWWTSHQFSTVPTTGKDSSSANRDILRLNILVQYMRAKFNDCLDKAEVLKNDIQILKSRYSGLDQNAAVRRVFVEKLIYNRALELSKISANLEIKNGFYYSNNCEVLYASSLWMLETLLEEPGDELDETDGRYEFDAGVYNIAKHNTSSLDDNDKEMIKKYITSIARRLKSLKTNTSVNPDDNRKEKSL